MAIKRKATILVVDDIPANRTLLRNTLEPSGYEVLLASDGEAGLKVAARALPDLILLDVMMPKMDGIETCRRLKAHERASGIPVIFITAKGEVQDIVDGFRAGGVDYIAKPFQMEEVLARVQNHLTIHQLTRELLEKNRALEEEIQRRQRAEASFQEADERLDVISQREAERWGIADFIGSSRHLGRLWQSVQRLQQTPNTTVLITGESGTGKELLARAIHFGSVRSKGPFIPVNCAAVPNDLAESLFFGHVRGAFSGAQSDQKGYFQLAHRGTLFLDEVGDMPLVLQPKLLRAFETGSFRAVGAAEEKTVDVRIVAATNADLRARLADGTFREDLYFRLANFVIDVPPLRERIDDLPALADHFLKLFATEMGKPIPKLQPSALEALAGHWFPGNVRELKSIIERAIIESGGRDIEEAHLHLRTEPLRAARANGHALTPPHGNLPLNLASAQALLVQRALAEAQGNMSKAAELLGINRTKLYRLLAKRGDCSDAGEDSN